MSAPVEITIPVDWEPRDYQRPAWEALESGVKRLDLVWHRRAGKDLFTMNWTATQAFQRRGLYWHVLPTYNQGRKIVWEGKTRAGRDFLSHFPQDLIVRKRDDQMTLWFEGGSVWQVIGAEEPDRLVGANPVGIVFSEWSLMTPGVWQLIRPILVENGGWAIFIYTPRGRNHAWRQRRMAQRNKRWFAQLLTADDTKAVTAQAIQEERESGMPENLIQQEFYCSFDAPLVGSYFGDALALARTEGRITKVPWEPKLPVYTAWDLGMRDALAIWFVQETRGETRLIDYYESSGVGIDHYHKVLREKPYAYAEHLVPHDASVRELGTGQSRFETALQMGLAMRIVPKLEVQDGIDAVRGLFPRMWIDEIKCDRGLQGLTEYTKEPTGLFDPDGRPLFRDKPKHDWASHPADALRTYAVGRTGPSTRKPGDRLAPRLAIV